MAFTNDQTSSPSKSLSAVPANGGSGYLAWNTELTSPFIAKSPSSQTGYALLNAENAGYSNMNSPSNVCFSMYAYQPSNNNFYCNAFRKLIEPLQDGGFFLKVRLGINFTNGFKGVQFLSRRQPVFTFAAFGTASQRYNYRWGNNYEPWDFSSGGVTGGYFSVGLGNYIQNSVFDITMLYSGNLYATVKRGVYSNTFLAPQSTPKDVDEIRFFVAGTDNSNVENNLYFNSLSGFSIYRL
jgi:hypothetical protein